MKQVNKYVAKFDTLAGLQNYMDGKYGKNNAIQIRTDNDMPMDIPIKGVTIYGATFHFTKYIINSNVIYMGICDIDMDIESMVFLSFMNRSKAEKFKNTNFHLVDDDIGHLILLHDNYDISSAEAIVLVVSKQGIKDNPTWFSDCMNIDYE